MPENINARNQRGSQHVEQELASKSLRIQNKRFFLDVKQNQRGRFVKITESGNAGHKSRILMSIPVAHEMQEKISKICDIYHELTPHDREALAPDGNLASDTIVRDTRRYYLDLRENERGRFLRLTMLSMGVRAQIAIPAHGITELRDGLADLIRDYNEDPENDMFSDLPASRFLYVGSKKFHFDVGVNRVGIFLRISEVRPNMRTSVTIPEQHCARFRDIIAELAKKMSEHKLGCTLKENGDGTQKEASGIADMDAGTVAPAPAA